MSRNCSQDRGSTEWSYFLPVFLYFSTGTTITLMAIEMDADCILLAKSIDGVYDSDPKVNPNAKKV